MGYSIIIGALLALLLLFIIDKLNESGETVDFTSTNPRNLGSMIEFDYYKDIISQRNRQGGKGYGQCASGVPASIYFRSK